MYTLHFCLFEVGKEYDDSTSLSQDHVVGKNTARLLRPRQVEPIQTAQLIIWHDKVGAHVRWLLVKDVLLDLAGLE